MSLAKRIKLIRDDLNLTQTDFATPLSITTRTLIAYELGQTKPNKKIAKMISQVYGVDFKYLDENSPLDDLPIPYISIPYTQLNKNSITLNYYEDVSASAGYGLANENTNPRRIILDKTFLFNNINFKNKTLDLIRVTGDSMLPILQDNDFVIVSRDEEPSNNSVVIANLNGEIFVKRFIKDITNEAIILSSSNKSYPDIILKDYELDNLQIVGVVVAKFQINIKQF